MWVVLLTGITDLAVVFLQTLEVLHVITPTQLGVFNAVMMFVAGTAKLVQQNIALTEAQKSALIESVQAAPTRAPRVPAGEPGDTVPMGPP